MRAYHQDAAASAEAFFGAWFRTGDVGRIGRDGRLTLVGRIKDEINRAGMKIAPAEIDLLLARHPDVVDACAFGIPDPVAGEMVGAAVVLREGARRDPDAIIGWCRDRIRSEAVPQKLFVMAAIPRTERGKISRRAVQDAALGQRAQ
jgi:acyl-coenzyme A synthetase/AMP-(fatty) acid ligase